MTETTTTGLGPLAAALAKASTAFPAVTRSKTVTVRMKDGGIRSFEQASRPGWTPGMVVKARRGALHRP